MKASINKAALRIAGIYVLVSVLWILLSDRFFAWLAGDFSQLLVFQTLKGLAFVLATGLLLYWFSNRRITALFTLQSRQAAIARQTIEEKEVLLRELHHRVKNNMQVILSLVNLKADKPDWNQDIRIKIGSMALVHELLYRSPDLASIPADDFIHNLVELLGHNYSGSQASLSMQADEFRLTATQAIPLGIFISEAYALFVDRLHPAARPRLNLQVTHVGLSCRLCIELQAQAGAATPPAEAEPPNGAGLPADLDLLHALAAQLDGQVEASSGSQAAEAGSASAGAVGSICLSFPLVGVPSQNEQIV